MQFFQELRRRNVIRVGGLYLVGAWLLTQVASTVFPAFDVPGWALRALLIALMLGFLPALMFAWVFELTPQGLVRDEDSASGEALAPRTARRIDRAIIVVLVCALGYFAFDKFVLVRKGGSAPAVEVEAAHRAATAVPTGKPDPLAASQSIAVLPLVNEGGTGEQYFSDGLSEDLITALSQFAGIKVIGRNSSFQFRDTKDDSRTIGAKLGVAHLLEGSVRRGGDVVRISAELVRTSDGVTLWSQRYDRPYTDLFKLQDEITAAVAAELKAKLIPRADVSRQSDRPPSGNLDAYNAYLQGNFFYARRTEADLRKAIERFGEATRLDPGYAYAWATVARTWITLGSNFLAGDRAQAAYGQARAAAGTALSLAPDLGAAHIARGYVLQVADFDFGGSEAEYRRAAQLAPDDGVAKFVLGYLLAMRGQLEPATALTGQALSVDPLHASWYRVQTNILAALGRLDEAQSTIRKAIELEPGAATSHQQLAVVAILRGDAATALAAAEQEPPGMWQDVALAMARQVGADRAAADAALDTLIARHAPRAAYQIAETHVLRNDPDKTFEWLDRAWRQHDPGIPGLLYDPLILRYRSDPRFSAFCAKIGLAVTHG
jgi:TolB-like protein/Tfp pilus assembly protein PilF